jgi:glycosyltransferase involved in cell wall biosynthesis
MKFLLKIFSALIPYRPLRKKLRGFDPDLCIQRWIGGKIHPMTVHYKEIPIYIVSFNRLECLKRLINCLENRGYRNIHIVDNASTYQPLLEYLRSIPYPVHSLDQNYGHLAFWTSGKFSNVIKTSYYVVSDPDVLPVEECPDDFIQYFLSILIKYPNVNKVGFSLKTDDIPDHFTLKSTVTEWESQFYKNTMYIHGRVCYKGNLDTTFALYGPRKGAPLKGTSFLQAIRTGFPYQARHLPWYSDSNKKTEEDVFYQNAAISESTTWCGDKPEEDIRRRYRIHVLL